MTLIVKITGGPTVWDATMAVDATLATHVLINGMVYPDEHPMLEHGNSAYYDRGYPADDGTNVFENPLPIGYAFSQVVPNYKIQEYVDTDRVYQLNPSPTPVESQRGEKGGPYDEAGLSSDGTADP